MEHNITTDNTRRIDPTKYEHPPTSTIDIGTSSSSNGIVRTVKMPNCTIVDYPNTNEYPFFNIFQSGSTCTLEIALAGWKLEDIELGICENELTLKVGHRNAEGSSNGPMTIVRGIKRQTIHRVFRVAPGTRVNQAWYKDGILTVILLEVPLKVEEIEIFDGPDPLV